MPRWERWALIREIWPAISSQYHVSTRAQCVSLLHPWMWTAFSLQKQIYLCLLSLLHTKALIMADWFQFLYIPVTTPPSRRTTTTLTQQTCAANIQWLNCILFLYCGIKSENNPGHLKCTLSCSTDQSKSTSNHCKPIYSDIKKQKQILLLAALWVGCIGACTCGELCSLYWQKCSSLKLKDQEQNFYQYTIIWHLTKSLTLCVCARIKCLRH